MPAVLSTHMPCLVLKRVVGKLHGSADCVFIYAHSIGGFVQKTWLTSAMLWC